jgi:hypothetical protein
MMKQAVVKALDRKKKQKQPPDDELLQQCLHILATYRRHCYTSDIGKQSLVVSKTMAFFPLYILAARKMLYALNMEKNDAVREENLRRVLLMPIHTIITALCPRAYALPIPAACEENTSEPASPKPRDAGKSFSFHVRDAKHMETALSSPITVFEQNVAQSTSPAYVFVDGSNAWLVRTDLGNSLEEKAPGAIAKLGRQACEHLGEKLRPCATPMAIGELPGTTAPENAWQDKLRLATLFVEDEGATGMSYTDWVAFLQGHVMHMLQG